MIELTQGQLVDLFVEKLKAHGPSTTGTYNKADPTHFEKGEAEFAIEVSWVKDRGQSNMRQIPEPEDIEVIWHDCTWGIEFTINVPSIKEPVTAYWSREFGNGKSHWKQAHPKFFKVVQDIIVCGHPKGYFEEQQHADHLGYYE